MNLLLQIRSSRFQPLKQIGKDKPTERLKEENEF